MIYKSVNFFEKLSFEKGYKREEAKQNAKQFSLSCVKILMENFQVVNCFFTTRFSEVQP